MDIPLHVRSFVAPVVGNYTLRKQASAPNDDFSEGIVAGDAAACPLPCCGARMGPVPSCSSRAAISTAYHCNKSLIGAACGVVVDPLDPMHDFIIADPQHFCIKRLHGSTVTVIAGRQGEPGYQDGHCSNARFSDPCGIAAGPDGTLYVADTGNHCVRVIARTGEVTTLAGGTTQGFKDGFGRGACFSELCDVHFMRVPADDDDTEDCATSAAGTPAGLASMRKMMDFEVFVGMVELIACVRFDGRLNS